MAHCLGEGNLFFFWESGYQVGIISRRCNSIQIFLNTFFKSFICISFFNSFITFCILCGPYGFSSYGLLLFSLFIWSVLFLFLHSLLCFFYMACLPSLFIWSVLLILYGPFCFSFHVVYSSSHLIWSILLLGLCGLFSFLLYFKWLPLFLFRFSFHRVCTVSLFFLYDFYCFIRSLLLLFYMVSSLFIRLPLFLFCFCLYSLFSFSFITSFLLFFL